MSHRKPGRSSPTFVDYVRRRACMFDLESVQRVNLCSGGVEVHHYPHKGMGGKNGDDRRTVPLCLKHHHEWHDTGKIAPFEHDAVVAMFVDEQLSQLLRYLDG